MYFSLYICDLLAMWCRAGQTSSPCICFYDCLYISRDRLKWRFCLPFLQPGLICWLIINNVPQSNHGFLFKCVVVVWYCHFLAFSPGIQRTNYLLLPGNVLACWLSHDAKGRCRKWHGIKQENITCAKY